jgi:hypothetical protein
MKVEVQITLQSEAAKTEVIQAVARLERGPLRPDAPGLSLAPSALDPGRAGADDRRRATRSSLCPKHGGAPVVGASVRAKVTTESCFAPLSAN